MTLFRRTLFSIFNLVATFLKALPLLVDQCPFSRKQNQTFFFHVYDFFQLAKNWLCCPYTEKYSRDLTKRHQTTQEDFSREPSYHFYPLNFYFLFPISFVFLVNSDLFWIEYRWKRPVYYLFYPTQGLNIVFGDEMLRTCVGRGRLNLLVSSPAKGAPFLSKLFLNRKIEKGEIWSLFGIVLAHGNGTIPQFHLFRFQNKRSVVFLFPWALSWCSKIVTRLSRTNNSKLGY